MQRYFEASCFKMAEKLRICGPPLKSLNFGGPCLGKLFFVLTNLEILGAWREYLESLNFGDPFGVISRFGTPKFYLFVVFTNFKIFMCLVLKVEKFEFWRARLGITLFVAAQFLLGLVYF